jgi:hypothetical protein
MITISNIVAESPSCRVSHQNYMALKKFKRRINIHFGSVLSYMT